MSTIVQAAPTEKVQATPLPQAQPCVLVIFGATGDLARRKLMPALFDLACVGCMDRKFDIVGVGRSALSDEEYRERMKEAVASSSESRDFNEERWAEFAKRLHYRQGDVADRHFFGVLRAMLDEMSEAGGSSNYLFYCATPASLAVPIIEGLGEAGLSRNQHGWARIILEKPFGRDLESARKLNQIVSRVFDERDVYRIDHYLGKETVQNIFVFRFGNSLFEPVWNRNYIDYVEITAAETLGVEGRAAFYEETGALRDVVANHLLQLLTLTAMEPPVSIDAEAVRDEKVKILRSIRPVTLDQAAKWAVRGQYGPGVIDGERVPGYRQEPGVAKDSNIETYAAVKFYVNNWRWAGVPFYIRAGKRLARRTTEVALHFKRTPQALFSRNGFDHMAPNVIVNRIQPNEGIAISFLAKRPGTQMQPVTVNMDFSYRQAFGLQTAAAYETLLLDVMRGDATLFTRGDEVEAEWRLITPILDAWAKLPPPQFPNYAAGSEGPEEANRLVAEDGHQWRPIGVTLL